MEHAENAVVQSATEDLSEKPIAELREVIARCRRLLAQPLVLSRLPGKEQELKIKVAAHEEELQRRATAVSTSATTTTTTASAIRIAEDEEQELAQREDYERFSRLMGDKYKQHRPNVEEEMRKSFNSMLSDGEIKRRLADIPNPDTFLMTYEETLAMERDKVRRERQRELQRTNQRRVLAVKFEEDARQRQADMEKNNRAE